MPKIRWGEAPSPYWTVFPHGLQSKFNFTEVANDAERIKYLFHSSEGCTLFVWPSCRDLNGQIRWNALTRPSSGRHMDLVLNLFKLDEFWTLTCQSWCDVIAHAWHAIAVDQEHHCVSFNLPHGRSKNFRPLSSICIYFIFAQCTAAHQGRLK